MNDTAQLSDSPDTDVVKQTLNGVLYITGLDLTLAQADIPYATPPNGIPVQGSVDVVIQAETLTLGSTITNPGRKIQITARRFIVNPGAVIDVSGATGAANFAPDGQPLPDQADQSASAMGATGADGGVGGAGGLITVCAGEMTGPTEGSAPATLTLIVNGGEGGMGQVGGNGLPGAPGQPGVTPTFYEKGMAPPQAGDGNMGGAGGTSGAGGVGGTGGGVTVSVVAPINPALVLLQSAGGPGGRGGPPGNGGLGGPPAYDGEYGNHWGMSGLPGMPMPNGAAGPTGSGALTPNGQYTNAQLGQQATLSLLQLVQQRADSAFLGQDYATAARLYGELIALTQAAVGAPTPTDPGAAADLAARVAINTACLCELSRLRQGLDFFGLRPDWAPTLTLTSLQDEILAMLTLAQQLDTSYQTLQNAQNSADQRRQALEDAQNQASNRLAVTQAQINAQQAQLSLFVASLARQQSEIDGQLETIEAMQFQDLFAQAHPGCSLAGALKTCQTVISTALSVESDYTAVTTAASALADSGTIMDAITNGISAITTVQSSIASIQQGYQGIVNLIDPTTHPDGGKLLTDEASYDQWIDGNITQYAQAQALKSAVSRYFDLVKTRNNNVLSYNAAVLQKQRLQAEADQQTAAFESIAAQLAEDSDVTDPAYTTLIQNADIQTRLYLLRRINDEIRAFNYWSVNNDGGAGAAVAMPTDSQLSTLQASQSAISQAIQGAATLPDTFQGLSVTFSRADHPDAFAALAASSDKRLIVRSDVIADGAAFPDMAHVTAEQVAVTLPDYAALNTGVLNVRVVHGGSGVFLQEDGVTPVRFSHAIRTAQYQYNYGSKLVTCTATLGDPTQGFLGLSPFTDWFIDFGNAGIDIDFETLSEVVLTFTGRCVPAQGI